MFLSFVCKIGYQTALNSGSIFGQEAVKFPVTKNIIHIDQDYGN